MERRIGVMAGLCAGLFAAIADVRAEEPEGDKAPQKERFVKRAGRARGQDSLRGEMRFTGQLRDAVMSELDLSEEQKAKMGPIFQGHNEAVQNLGRAPHESQPDGDAEERLAELERQAQAARESGDREEAKRIRQEIVELRRGGADPHAAEARRLNGELIENLKAELTEEQSGKFDAIVQRIRAQGDGGESIMRLMQAGRRASARVELDDEQRKQVNEALRNAVRGSMQDGERPQNPEAVMEGLRTEIHSVLGAELGAQFMQALQEEQSAMASRGPGAPAPGGRPAEPQASEEEGAEGADKDED